VWPLSSRGVLRPRIGHLAPCLALIGLTAAGLWQATAASADYNAAVARFDSSGGLTTLTAPLFTQGWTAIQPEPGNGLELFYNASSGNAASVRFDSSGNTTTTWSGTFNPNWTSVEPTNNGLMLFYSASSGQTVGVSFNASGVPTSLSGDALNGGWTTVTALSGGVQLFYNRNTGVAAAGTIDGAGHFHQVGSQTMSAGWQIVTRLPNDLEFFYNPNGLAAVGKWNGSTVATLKSYTISNGWTSLTPTGFGQEAFYNAATGHMAIGTFDSSGNLNTTTRYDISPDWDFATALPGGGGLTVFYSHKVHPGSPAPSGGPAAPPPGAGPPSPPPPSGGTTQPSSPPAQGSVVNAVRDTGTVRVKLPSGAGFVPLASIDGRVPVGSTLDTKHGTVHVFAATNAAGRLQDGHFHGGLFVIDQGRKNPLTTLSLAGGSLNLCGATGTPHLRKRTLIGAARGRFRTRGRDSVATVRNARWRVTDTCAGTLTVVQRGTVQVRDLVKHRTVKLGPGQSYLARRGNR
jgi:hypothetical protein